MNRPQQKFAYIIGFILISNFCFGQCPTVLSNTQEFCDVESSFVSDLNALDEGEGIGWFTAPIGGTPLDDNTTLIDGATYYLDNAAGNCGTREAVTVSILGPPSGSNFQGVCVEEAEDATIADLEAFGFDVQWYDSPFGGDPLDLSTVLTDDTIYYADQASVITGCRTSRLSVLVNFNVVAAPEGDALQEFCFGLNNVPTVGNLEATGNNNWYISPFSATPLDLSETLIDNQTYYASNLDPPCESSSRLAVTVNLIPNAYAGENSSIDVCENETGLINLFDALEGTPDPGGTWTPQLSSGSDFFNVDEDAPGVYTYTVSATSELCNDDSATVTINLISVPSAGLDAMIDICDNSTELIDLFDILGGSPTAGGSWMPALNSGTSIFNPTIDTAGEYTYTIASNSVSCEDETAVVTVNIFESSDAGTNGSLSLCSDDSSTYDLFEILGGNPDPNGTWSPALNSGTSIFDPNLDEAGLYTYTVSSNNTICEDASATVNVSILQAPSAGNNGVLDLCSVDAESVDLFESLGGAPDSNGTWSPALSSGTGIFDPDVDAQGIYTYTVTEPQCGLSDAAEVEVIINENQNLNAMDIDISNICLGDDLSISLNNINSLSNGSYTFGYSLAGPQNTMATASVSIVDGQAEIIIPSSSLTTIGDYEFSISSIIANDTGCVITINIPLRGFFQINERSSPELIEEGNVFCIEEEATLADLSNSILGDGTVEWYDSFEGGTPLDESEVLLHNNFYYATLINEFGCRSNMRLEVQVVLESCVLELIIPDGFSPNGDTINDAFIITNLPELYPNFKLTIFNRNGNKLYEGDINSNPWDGTTTTNSVGNGIVPVGVYFYVLEFNNGTTGPKQGRVYLSR